MAIGGTDTSSWQPPAPNLDGDQFDIVKATEGVGYADAHWAAQIDNARTKNVLPGHYHFANGLNTPEAEAEYFWSVIKTKWQTGEPLGLDVEGDFFNRVADPVAWALRFAQRIYGLTGLKVLLYIDWQHEKSKLYSWQPLVDYNCGLWGAAYNPNGFGDPAPWSGIAIWQNSNTNISGGDSDVFYGDRAAFIAYGTPAPIVIDPAGDTTMALTQADADLVVNTFMQRVINREGPGATGATNPQEIFAWLDSNIAALGNLIRSVALTPTDAQVQALVDKLTASLPPATLALLKSKL